MFNFKPFQIIHFFKKNYTTMYINFVLFMKINYLIFYKLQIFIN